MSPAPEATGARGVSQSAPGRRPTFPGAPELGRSIRPGPGSGDHGSADGRSRRGPDTSDGPADTNGRFRAAPDKGGQSFGLLVRNDFPWMALGEMGRAEIGPFQDSDGFQ